MRAAILFNRRSGRGADPALESAMRSGLTARGIPFEVFVPERKGEMTELARRAATGGFDLVVAAGGDGTVNEVVNGALGHGVTLGVLPCGTVNVWARCLGVPLDLQGALDVLARGQARPVSLGRANDRAFTFCLGCGFDGEVISREDLGLKKIVGRYAYYWGVTAGVWTHTPPRLELSLDGEPPIPCELVIFGKTPLYGDRFHMTPNASPFAPDIDVCIFRRFSAWRLAKVLFYATRDGSHDRLDYILQKKLRQATLTSPDVARCQIDGEAFGTLPLTVEALPDAVRVVLPAR